MKPIYDAVRALLYPGDANHKAGSQYPYRASLDECPFKLRRALTAFELHNRGHRAALARYELDGTALHTLKSTSAQLICELLPLAPASYPKSLDALLDAPGDAEICEGIARDILKRLAKQIPEVGPDAAYRVTSLTFMDGSVQSSITVWTEAKSQPLFARRSHQLSPGGFSTLRMTLRYVQSAQAFLTAELSRIATWSEYGPNRVRRSPIVSPYI